MATTARQHSFKDCMALMRKHDAMTQEEGFSALLRMAKDHVPELMAEFERETDHGLRCWLLELIGEARSAEAFDLLCGCAHSADESFNSWAIRGLQNLDTRQSRTFLFQHGLGQ